ncbi:MAG: hypothetical protein AB7E60_10955 [Sphingobium sp.]
MAAIPAFLMTCAACACLYLVSPNQKWLGRPLARAPLLTLGLALMAGGLWSWMVWLQPLAGLFAAVHVVMACLFAFPYICALRAAWQGR